MLSNEERRRFEQIAEELAADPRFAARSRLPAQRPFPAVAVLLVLLYILTPVVVLLGGWTAYLCTLTMWTATIAVLVLRRRHRRRRPWLGIMERPDP